MPKTDRLLSEQEISDMIDFRHDTMKALNKTDSVQDVADCMMIAKAQLSKSDKEWVEWAESDCPHHRRDSGCPGWVKIASGIFIYNRTFVIGGKSAKGAWSYE